jgi:cyclopropane fatty-acyl-phospholipid synthase-like methyltransferase
MYQGAPPWDTKISPPELFRVIDSTPPGNALDIGCGTATNVITLAKSGWTVTGIDFIRRPIELGKKKARLEGVNVNLVVADVTKIVFEEKFDLILDMGCFHNLSKQGRIRYIRSIKDWLNFGGYFLLYGFLKHDGLQAKRGINSLDINNFENFLILKNRQAGIDRSQKSSWFIFQKGDGHQVDSQSE